MARPASSYRGARRNACLRGDVRVPWGRAHYFGGHVANYLRLAHPPVRPNERDRSDRAMGDRAWKIAQRSMRDFFARMMPNPLAVRLAR